MIVLSVDNAEQKLKVITEIQDVQHRGALDSMFADKDNKKQVKEVASELVALGYQVQKICCGECDQDDVLVVIHTCNPHRFTHTCEPKNKDK